MTYFVCVAVPQKAVSRLFVTFVRVIHLTNITESPFGKATCGENQGWNAYLLQVGSSSASLINGEPKKKNLHDVSCPALFVSGINTLIEEGSCSSVNFLIHVMLGLIDVEKIRVREQKAIKLIDLAQSLPSSQEDVRYTVTK